MNKETLVTVISKMVLIMFSLLFSINCVNNAEFRQSKHYLSSYTNLLRLYYMEEEAISNADVFLREEFLEHGSVDSVDTAHRNTSTVYK